MAGSVTAPRDPTRRNVLLLAACQAIAMSGSSLIATVAALAGYLLAEDKSLATVPVACQFLATMLTTIPASLVMRRIGRRAGFTIGQCIGLAGAAISCAGLFDASFEIFTVGAVLLGAHNAFWQYYRFAAADTAREDYRSRAISYVLAGGVIAAFIGPELATFSIGLFDPVRFAGNYAAVMCLILCAIVVIQFVDIPILTDTRQKASGRPLRVIAVQPVFIVAVLSAMLGYAVMALVMTATPLSMEHGGLGIDDTAFVIEWHLIGMFAPSFFTGHLIGRFGALNVITAGVALMIGSIAVGISGADLFHFWAALLLVGLGWNFMFVGGSSLLTECYFVEERAKVQALNDFMVFSATAAASFSSGAIEHHYGWNWVNLAMVAPMLIVLAATVWLRMELRYGRIPGAD